MAAEPSFLCTFCWTPQLWPAKPRVLGREARIACETCWKGVLDLSICWVCGEIVVRGEEVISLGWCFWHRGCFGCLLCGTSLDPPMKDKCGGEELHWIDVDDSDDRNDGNSGYIDGLGKERTNRQRGVELVRIPLCSWCDNATEGLYNAQVLDIGLQNVAKKDGGLSESRLDMQRKAKFKDTAPLWQTPRTLSKGQVQLQNNMHEHECRANRLTGTGDLGVGEDGNADDKSNYSNPAESISPTPPPMYVSVLNATGEPSFRASRTKPLPSWMTLLPSNRQPMYEQDRIATTSPDDQVSLRGLNSTVAEQTSDSHTPFETNVTVSDLHSHRGLKRIRNTGVNTAVGLKREDATSCELAFLKDTEDGIADDKESLNYRATCSQRSSTPYSLGRDLHRPPMTSLQRQEAVTNMPARQMQPNGSFFPTLSSQVAIPLLSRDGKLKKLDFSREEEPIGERFQRQERKKAILSSGQKKEISKGMHQGEPGYVDDGDELRKELLKSFNIRREVS